MQRSFTAVLSRSDMQADAPLAVAIESFFRANYDLAPKTEALVSPEPRRIPRLGRAAPWPRTPDRRPRQAGRRRIPEGADGAANPQVPQGSPFTARAAALSLKRLASFLAEDGILSDQFGCSVLKHVKRTKLDEDVRQPLSDSDLFRILAAAGSPGTRDYALLVLAAGTGLRLNELRELRIADLDLGDRTVTVRPETSKFGRGRIVP